MRIGTCDTQANYLILNNSREGHKNEKFSIKVGIS